MLGELDGESVVIADLEAGVGTLSRLPAGGADVLVVVVEPTLKSIEVGRRILALAAQRHPETRVTVIGNKVTDEVDADRIKTAFGAATVMVPEDPGILRADRDGLSPVDASPDSDGTRALVELADNVLGR